MLVDASNALNAINRKAFLHNVKIICPSIATFTTNCYRSPSRLFVVGGTEITSAEGTTQGDPIAGFVYAIAIIPMILRTVEDLHKNKSDAKATGYADDLFGGGKLAALRKMWDFIEKHGPDYGYYQQADKTWIINSKIDEWVGELTLLSEIAAFAPQEAYVCFTSGYRHKLNFCMRTIPGIGKDLKRVDEVVSKKLIPAITGGIQPNETERKLYSLPPSLGGLGIPIFSEQADIEFANSKALTEQLQQNISSQDPSNNIDKDEIKKIKNRIKAVKKSRNLQLLEAVRGSFSEEKNKLLDISCEKGASLWLTTLPIKDEGFQIDKQSFWDLLKIRFGYQLTRLPNVCACG